MKNNPIIVFTKNRFALVNILRLLIVFVFLMQSIFAYGQKFMINGKDTLPYKEKMIIRNDTSYVDKIEYLKTDTLYEGRCQTFEKIEDKIVNRTDSTCSRQGFWIEPYGKVYYRAGIYKNNERIGLWKLFNRNKKLLEETEELYLGNKLYAVKKVLYINGRPKMVLYKPILAFFIRYYIVFIGIWVSAFLIRMCINSEIYNLENDTGFPVIGFENRFFNRSDFDNQSKHTLRSAFTIWFFRYKPENHKLVRWSNVLLLISIGAFGFLLWGYVNLVY